MSDGEVLVSVMKEISDMGKSLSNKMDGVNENVTEVKTEVAELRGVTETQLENHQRSINDLQKGHQFLASKVNENVKTLAVHEQRMNNGANLPTGEELDVAIAKADPYIKKLLKLRYGDMTVAEQRITLGGGVTVTIGGIVMFVLEVLPRLLELVP